MKRRIFVIAKLITRKGGFVGRRNASPYIDTGGIINSPLHNLLAQQAHFRPGATTCS